MNIQVIYLFKVSQLDVDGKYTADQIEQMLYVQGGSIIEVVGDKKGGWKMVYRLLNMHAVLLD